MLNRKFMTEQEWLVTFGDNLVDILNEYEYDQKEFARECHLSEAAISSYIHKKRMPGVKALVNMSRVLGISLDELMNFGYMVT